MIRKANHNDIPNVLELSHALFLDPTSASDKFADADWPFSESGRAAFEGAAKEGFLWVAEEDDRVVGFICAEVSPPLEWRPIKRVELLSFYIEPDYRSKGMGAKLVNELLGWAKEHGAVTVFVSAYADNARGIDFYRKMGFKDEATELELEL